MTESTPNSSLELNQALADILPPILHEQREGDSVTLTLKIPADLVHFNGHFPGTPILPGVVQLHWVVAFVKQTFALADFEVRDVEVLKFKTVIVPDQQLELTLTRKKADKFAFSYQSDKGLHASGRLVIEFCS